MPRIFIRAIPSRKAMKGLKTRQNKLRIVKQMLLQLLICMKTN